MGEVALRLVEEALPVDQKALTYTDVIKALPPIKTAGEYVRIGDLWKEGRALLKEIDDGYDDLIKAAHKLHKDAVAKKAKYYTPVDGAVRAAKSLMSAWDAAQESIRLAEQARLEAIARKQEEERRKAELERLEAERKAEEDRLLAEAVKLEKLGDMNAVDEVLKAAEENQAEAAQEAAAIQAEPVYIPPVVLPKATPKVAGMSFSVRWSASVIDIKALCLAIGTGRASTELVIGLDRDSAGVITSPSLNKQAVSLRDSLCIPGVKAISKRV
jgi:hypothetical protein